LQHVRILASLTFRKTATARGRIKCGSGNIGTKERENADDENAGVETSARFCRGGKCGSGNIGTILQPWVENVGVEKSARLCMGGKCGS